MPRIRIEPNGDDVLFFFFSLSLFSPLMRSMAVFGFVRSRSSMEEKKAETRRESSGGYVT